MERGTLCFYCYNPSCSVTCDAAQVKEFFGPVRLFICEDEDPGSLLVFSHYQGKLKVDRFENTLG